MEYCRQTFWGSVYSSVIIAENPIRDILSNLFPKKQTLPAPIPISNSPQFFGKNLLRTSFCLVVIFAQTQVRIEKSSTPIPTE